MLMSQRMQTVPDGAAREIDALPLPETRWRHHRDADVHVVVTESNGRKIVYRRCLTDGTRGLERESGIGRFLGIFVPEAS